MANEGEAVQSEKKLVELRVIDLKAELERRGLEKTGVKAALIERLKKAIADEGKNPEEYIFEVHETTPVKKAAVNAKKITRPRGRGSGEGDEEGVEDEEMDETEEMDDHDLDMENMIDVDEVKGDEAESELKDDAGKENPKTLGESGEGEDVNNGDAILLLPDDEKLLDEDMSNDENKMKPELKEAVPTGDKPNTLNAGLKSSDSASQKKDASGGKDVPGVVDSVPPTPTSVPPIVPFTKEDTIKLDTSVDRKDDDLSLIVHVDDTQNDLDNDILDKKEGSMEREQSSEQDGSKGVDGTTKGKSAVNVSSSGAADDASDIAATKESTKAGGESAKKEGDSKTTDSKTDAKKTEGIKKEADKGKSTPSKDSKAADKTKSTAKPATSSSRNLWVSGLSSNTRATDLKTLFSKYGKVAGAKVVTNARSPGSRCYGFVTMSTAEEASKCIQHLHRTELHGRMISVERAKGDPAAQAKSAAKPKSSSKPSLDKASEPKKDEKGPDKKENDKKEAEKKIAKDDKKPNSTSSKRHSSGDHRHGPASRPRHHSSGHTRPGSTRHSPRDNKRPGHSRTRSSPGTKSTTKESPKDVKKSKTDSSGKEPAGKEPAGKEPAGKEPAGKSEEKKEDKSEKKEEKTGSKDPIPEDKEETTGKSEEILSFDKIKEERDRERLKARERALREEEKRRMRELERERQRQRDIERRQREEAIRLEREANRLRNERLRLERERLEAERQERDRARLERERRERERLEREREEQRKLEQLRLEEQRRAQKRTYDSRGTRDDPYWESKRPAVADTRGTYSDFDHRRYDDRAPEQDTFTRRVERVTRDGRPIDQSQTSRYETRREETSHRDSRDTSRRSGPASRDARDRDERRVDDRNRYTRGSDTATRDRRDSGSNTTRSRQTVHGRDPSPSRHHDRQRSHDARSDWKSQRGPSGSTQDRRDTRDSRSYQDSVSKGSVQSRGEQWGSSKDSSSWAQLSSSSISRQSDRWPISGQSDRSVSIRPAVTPGGLVLNQPMMQATPPVNAFLSSAANIMMGVGMASSRQEPRYDAYKGPQASSVTRRY